MKLINAAFFALSLAAVSAQALAAVALKTEAFHEVEVTDKNGQKTKKVEPLNRATPGQEVIYVLSYSNTGKEPVSNVVLSNPVPAELAYVAGSAKGAGTRIEASVDGGKIFGAFETLRVKKADGTVRPATGNDVTHLRWTVTTPVQAGATGSATYRAVLR